ncbi:hypothetical protein ACH5RR_040366 [Cinchona calisaya]|uniref:Uncharacterized protein n=1 Tax=Cinchona calisaya TaxID=153742 RepID=A0ABD2XTW7_9GENT
MDDIDKPALEEEKVVEEIDNRSEEKYRKKLEKFEKKWVKNMENVKEKYKEKCKNWKQQENDLLSKLSSVSSQAGFYKIQVSESEEKLRRLEDEKIELITKLTTANASSELYRSLLHDPSSTQQCWPSL